MRRALLATIASTIIVLALVVAAFASPGASPASTPSMASGVAYQGPVGLGASSETNSLTSTTSLTNSSSLSPFIYPEFMTWGCSESSTVNNTAASEPCWGGGIDQANVFNCTAAAASSAGCSITIPAIPSTTPDANNQNLPTTPNTLTVWFPYSGTSSSSEPSWANCYFQVKLFPIASPQNFGYCALLNSTAFVISQPGSAPVPL